LSKYDEEFLCLMVGGAYEIPTVALRFFNVHGPHQARSNPYSGVLAIFAAWLLNERPLLIFEDGEQRRDFVYAGAVVEACRLALEVEEAVGRTFDIGSGRPVTVKQVARLLADTLAVLSRRSFDVANAKECCLNQAHAKPGFGRPTRSFRRGTDRGSGPPTLSPGTAFRSYRGELGISLRRVSRQK
jgi:dTDP-L-rhamnose 4-epimerase